MLIRTEDQNRSWKYWNLFDTVTGLRYSLQHPTRDKEMGKSGSFVAESVRLSINSAHSANTEEDPPMTYQGIEALDFWALRDGTLWGKEAHKEATEVLEQIQKQEEEASLREEERHPELDDDDSLPF